MSKNRILIINDIAGYGRVSTMAMLPVMTQFGLHPYVLPTALVSNTLDYGSAAILDTTEFMINTIEKWNGFGFGFDTICTGLLNSSEQVDIICSLIDKQEHPFVYTDPIMADYGELYPDMYQGVVEANRRLAARADVIIPNFTEAVMLADCFAGRDSLNQEEYGVLLDKIRSLGPSDVIITGCRDTDGSYFNLVYTSEDNNTDYQYYNLIPGRYIGTGDMFSACLISAHLQGSSLNEAAAEAAEFVRNVIINNIDNKDTYDIALENSLSYLSKYKRSFGNE